MRNMMGKLQPFIHVPYFFSDAFDHSYEFWAQPSHRI
jgi:3-phenylpropionate/trans-cinnamate dioxygenase ferredoxin reductase subunit